MSSGRPAPPSEPAPLTLEQAERIISQIQVVASREDVVLIGGQAVAFWTAQFEDRVNGLQSRLVASKDIDFQGRRDDLTAAAKLLGGRVVLPADVRTRLVGITKFVDADLVERQLDFLSAPYGLEAEDIVHTAIPIEIIRDNAEPIPLRVMHPQRCLESRVHNNALPNKQTVLAKDQIRAAIACARAFSELLLDDTEDRRRDVLNLNERTFRFALENAEARRLAVEDGIEVFDAVVFDSRLGDKVLTLRQPQMEAAITAQRRQDGRAE